MPNKSEDNRGVAPSAVPAWSFLAVSVVVIGAYPACSANIQLVLFLLIELGSITALFYGARRQPDPRKRRPWLAIAGSGAGALCAALTRILVPGTGPDAPPTNWLFLPDAFVIPSYILCGYALVTFLRRRHASVDDPALADAVVLGLGASLATWAFLIAPRFATHMPSLPILSAAIFPMADVALLVMVVRLLLAGGTRSASLWLIAGSLTGIFTGDLLYALQIDRIGPSDAMAIIDVSLLTGLVCIAAAALHPTMCDLTEPQSHQVRRMTSARTVGMGLILTGALCVGLLVQVPLWNRIVQLTLGIMIVVVLLTRMVSNQRHRERAEHAERHRHTHDGLTDLANRELLVNTLTTWYDQARGEGTEFSLLFIDLDKFKAVNDRLGHAAGDEVLIAVAERLRTMVRAEDLVCRIGSDEFVIALASPSHDRLAESLASRIVEVFDRPFDETEVSVSPLKISASVGFARSTDATAALELIRAADTAMYRVKGAGRNGYAGFAAPMHEVVRWQATLAQNMTLSLTNGELAVVYQPIVDLRDEHVAGFEALMRWNSSELGPISPMDFIPIAEDTGYIVKAGAWLLEEAMSHLAIWTHGRPADAPEIHVSVNVSARQLRGSENFVDTVRGVLNRTGLAPSALWLELTESATLQGGDQDLAVLRDLADLGVTLCLDDFGTGFSSLTYLKDFPSGIVKIDRSFVSGIGRRSDDETIVQMVINVAHDLGRRVVAEGVETVEQRDWLRDRGCDLVQGYLYGRPEDAQVARDIVVHSTTIDQNAG